MSTATKDPLAPARVALEVGEAALPPCSPPKSPRTYAQPQLFAMIALEEPFGKDWRGVVERRRQWSDLREALAIRKAPHCSTLRNAEKRLLKKGALPGSSMSAFASPSVAA